MDSIPELLPCPYCGQKPALRVIGDACQIECEACGVSTDEDVEASEVVGWWNDFSRRAIHIYALFKKVAATLNPENDAPVIQPFSGGPHDPYDGDANPEYGPLCRKCNVEMQWEDCDNCGATGHVETDTDDYTEKDMYEECGRCLGFGGWWFCGCGAQITDGDWMARSEIHEREE